VERIGPGCDAASWSWSDTMIDQLRGQAGATTVRVPSVYIPVATEHFCVSQDGLIIYGQEGQEEHFWHSSQPIGPLQGHWKTETARIADESSSRI
jgi:hypothetical protein